VFHCRDAARRAERVHSSARVFRDAKNVIALVFAFQRGAANRVDVRAACYHVVVSRKVFARVEVLRFDGFFAFSMRREIKPDSMGTPSSCPGGTSALYALAAENRASVVFEQRKKTRGAGIALASRASRNWLSMRRAVAFRAGCCRPPSATTSSCRLCTAQQTARRPASTDRRALENLAFVLEEHIEPWAARRYYRGSAPITAGAAA